jgi:hypothetical protein
MALPSTSNNGRSSTQRCRRCDISCKYVWLNSKIGIPCRPLMMMSSVVVGALTLTVVTATTTAIGRASPTLAAPARGHVRRAKAASMIRGLVTVLV